MSDAARKLALDSARKELATIEQGRAGSMTPAQRAARVAMLRRRIGLLIFRPDADPYVTDHYAHGKPRIEQRDIGAGFGPAVDWYGRMIRGKAGPLGGVTKSLGKVGTATAKAVGKTAIRAGELAVKGAKKLAKSEAMAFARTALKNSGPWGMVANGALSALEAAVRGESLEEIAWAAAEGAAPTGIDRAISAAHRLRKGEPVLSVALAEVKRELVPGSLGEKGFNVAERVMKGQRVDKAALAEARRSLPNDEARRGFDLAVGTVSRASRGAKKGEPMSNTRTAPIASAARGLTAVDPMSASRVVARTLQIRRAHPTVAMAASALDRSPALGAMAPADAARRLNLPVRAVADAMAARRRRLAWRPLSRRAAGYVSRFSLVSPAALSLSPVRDTGALEPGGKTYVVEKNDYPVKIAQKLIGDGGQWKALIKANPQKPVDPKTGNFKTLYAGEKLNVPESWWPKTIASAPGLPGVTSAPAPSGAPPTESAMTSAAMVAAKAALAAWGKTDGAGSAGFEDYGLNPADVMPVWGSRDKFMLSAFSVWHNAQGKSPTLSTEGELTQAHVDALKAWAEAKASGAAPSAPAPTAPTPTAPAPTTSPGQPTSSAPPTGAPSLTLPGIIQAAAQAAAQAAQAGGQAVPTSPAPSGPLPAPPSPIPLDPAPPSSTAKKDDGAGDLGFVALLAAVASLIV